MLYKLQDLDYQVLEEAKLEKIMAALKISQFFVLKNMREIVYSLPDHTIFTKWPQICKNVVFLINFFATQRRRERKVKNISLR